MNLDPKAPIIVDAHVHLHSCFDVITSLNRAQDNFNRVALQLQSENQYTGALFLTEGEHEKSFSRLQSFFEQKRATDSDIRSEWRVHYTEESITMFLRKADHPALLVVAGRQIVSQENLELLAIGTRYEFEEKAPLKTLIEQTVSVGAIPIIPWGFGKWTGQRGKFVQTLLEDPSLPPFFLGDSGNRPGFIPKSPLFNEAASRGILNVPGSDPLPFSHDETRLGSFGFVLDEPLGTKTPGKDLITLLKKQPAPLPLFGRGESLLRFVQNQIGMQLRKKIK